MEYLKIGHITNTIGLKGHLRVYPYTDFIVERYKINNQIYILKDDKYHLFYIENYQLVKNLIKLKLKGLDDINDGLLYKGNDIYINKDHIHSLKKGEYYIDQLIGLQVYDQYNNNLGHVIEVLIGIKHNNLRISNDKSNFLIPNIKPFITNIDLDNNKIYIKIIDGLI